MQQGPGTWVTVRDLEHLKAFGMEHQLRTLDCTSKAAKLRVASTAADCGEQCEALQRSLMEDLKRPFGSWHCKPYFKVLCDNQKTLAAMGITLREVRSKAHSATSKRCKRNDNFQTVARALVQTKTQPYDADRLRHKIKRWRLEGPPAHVASRLLKNIQIVGSKCRPCVAGMFFRTLWNGWPTSARMRTCKDATTTMSCVLGCPNAEDRIEHYLICEKTWAVLQQPQPHGLGLKHRALQTMLLARRGMSDDEIANTAIAVYAIARTVHSMRQENANAYCTFLRLYSNEGRKR